MYANQNLQLSGTASGVSPGKATPPQGACERFVSVGGDTYRYRRYLKKIGLQWSPQEKAWNGRLGDGRILFIMNQLGLDVWFTSPQKEPNENVERVSKLRSTPKPSRKIERVHDPCCWTAAEYYVAGRLLRGPDKVRPEKNINLRRCMWNMDEDVCASCLECISNINENGEPRPEIYTEIEESEAWQRKHATLPIDA